MLRDNSRRSAVHRQRIKKLVCLAGQYVDPFPLFRTNIAAMLNGMEREEIDTD